MRQGVGGGIITLQDLSRAFVTHELPQTATELCPSVNFQPAYGTPIREFLILRKEQEGSDEMDRQNTKESIEWQALLSPWQELKNDCILQFP